LTELGVRQSWKAAEFDLASLGESFDPEAVRTRVEPCVIDDYRITMSGIRELPWAEMSGTQRPRADHCPVIGQVVEPGALIDVVTVAVERARQLHLRESDR